MLIAVPVCDIRIAVILMYCIYQQIWFKLLYQINI